MRIDRTTLLALLPAGAGIVLSLCKRGERTLDDAFILFRYADNLLQGHGLTFNPGERVEGYSSLLFVLILAATRTAGISHVLSSNLVSLASLVVATVAAHQLARRALSESEGAAAAPLRGAAGFGAACLVALSNGFVDYGRLGMETALQGALCAVALVAKLREDQRGTMPLPSGLLFGLCALNRPEGISIYVAAAIAGVGRVPLRRESSRAAFALALPFLQVVARLAYYGHLLPNTFHAKIYPGSERWVLGGVYLGDFLKAQALPLLLVGLAGGLWLARRSSAARVLLAVAAAGFAFAAYSGGDLFPSFRFLVPTFPALAALLAAGTARVAASLGTRVAPAALALVVLHALGTSGWYRSAARYALPLATLPARVAEGALLLGTPSETLQVRLGKFLGKELPPDATLTVGDCGRIPYFSGLRVVDSLGLMDEHVARSPGGKDRKRAAPYLLERNTDYYLLRLAPVESHPARQGQMVDNVLAWMPAFQSRSELRGYFPWDSRTAYYLFGRDERLLVDFARAVKEGRASTRGDVRVVDAASPQPAADAAATLRDIGARPFALLPRGSELGCRARLLWSVPAVELQAGAALTFDVPTDAVLELGLHAPGGRVDVVASGVTTSLQGVEACARLALPAGPATIEVTTGPSVRLLAPRLVRAEVTTTRAPSP